MKFSLAVMIVVVLTAGRAVTSEAAISPKAEEHFKKGVAYFQKGDLQKAAREYGEAVKIDSGFVEAWANLGDTEHRRENFQQAETILRKAISLDSTLMQARENLASLLADLDRWPEVVTVCREALAIDPNYERNYVLQVYLGTAFIMRLDVDSSEDAYSFPDTGRAEIQKGIEMKPDYLDGHYWLGECYEVIGFRDSAALEYKRMMELDPHSAKAYNALGNILYVNQDWTGAAAMFKKALKYGGPNAIYHSNLGHAYAGQLTTQIEPRTRLMTVERALREFRKATRLNPNLGGSEIQQLDSLKTELNKQLGPPRMFIGGGD